MVDVKVTDSEVRKLIKSFKGMEPEFTRINKLLTRRLPKKLKSLLENETPKDTGETARKWKINNRGSNGFSMENGNGGIIEFLVKGVKPHKIEPKDSSVLAIKLPTSILFAKFVDHPGYSSQMNMTSIWNRINVLLEQEINDIITEIIIRRLKF